MLAKITVADYMSKNLVKLSKDTNVVDAIKILLDHKITSAPVVDPQGQLLGMFSERMSCVWYWNPFTTRVKAEKLQNTCQQKLAALIPMTALSIWQKNSKNPRFEAFLSLVITNWLVLSVVQMC